jgi:DNA-binding winged helix-turn-helix (wHTH) protein/TolB-like protein/Flp pilus assembly protein TadD
LRSTIPQGGSIPSDTTRFYEFGPFRLDLLNSQLLRDGEALPLTPKAIDMLLLLVRRHGRVLEKSELMSALWPDSFVEEANLSQHVFLLRKTLGAQVDGKPYIETVAKRGYYFAAEVREVREADALASPSATAGALRPARPRTVRRLVGSAVGLLIVVALAFVGYRVRGRGDARKASTEPTESSVAVLPVSPTGEVAAAEVRLVVLPFENLTRQPADDWLAGALADSLTLGVQDLQPLVLVNRERVVELYNQRSLRDGERIDADVVRELVRVLRVQYYVHGSYQKIGAEVKVVARLMDVATGSVRAQASVTDRFANIFRLEDELARRFAAGLEATSDAHRGLPRTASLQAYRAFSEARTLYAQNRTDEAVKRSRAAIDDDPGYAPAWALLSKCLSRLGAPAVFAGGDLEERRRLAVTAARKAVELEPPLYDGHVALALAYRELGQADPWRSEARKAIALNPRMAEAYALMGDTFYTSPVWGCNRDRDADLAARYYRQSLRLDHRSVAAWGNLAGTLEWVGRFPEGLAAVDEGLGILGENRNLRRRRAEILLGLGRTAEAEEEIRMGLQGRVPNAPELLALGGSELARGRPEAASRRFGEAIAMAPHAWIEVAVARYYARAGDLGRSAFHLESALRKEPACAQFVMRCPLFDGHRDQAVRAVLQKYGAQPL